MVVKDLIKKLLDFDQNTLVFALTKKSDVGEVAFETVPEILVGTIGSENSIVVLVSDFDKYREKDEVKEDEKA